MPCSQQPQPTQIYSSWTTATNADSNAMQAHADSQPTSEHRFTLSSAIVTNNRDATQTRTDSQPRSRSRSASSNPLSLGSTLPPIVNAVMPELPLVIQRIRPSRIQEAIRET